MMDTRNPTGSALLAALFLCLAPAASAADYSAAVNATSVTRNLSGAPDSDVANSTAPIGGLSATSSITEQSGPPQFGLANGSGNSTATAASGLGALNVFAGASAQLTNVPFSAPMVAGGTSSSSARFKDSFTISCTGLVACADGQQGTMTVGFLVLGNAGGSGTITPTGTLYNGGFSGYAQWAASLSVVATSPVYPNGTVGASSWAGGKTVRESEVGPSVGDYNVSYPLAEFGLRELTLDFVFGQPVFVDMLAMAGASAGVGYDSSGSSAEASFQSSLRPAWAGVSQITGLGGASLAGVASLSALSATSGLNYMNSQVPAVPEPETALMLVSGLLLTSWAVRRRNVVRRS
jgi:hypothetical protein